MKPLWLEMGTCISCSQFRELNQLRLSKWLFTISESMVIPKRWFTIVELSELASSPSVEKRHFRSQQLVNFTMWRIVIQWRRYWEMLVLSKQCIPNALYENIRNRTDSIGHMIRLCETFASKHWIPKATFTDLKSRLSSWKLVPLTHRTFLEL